MSTSRLLAKAVKEGGPATLPLSSATLQVLSAPLQFRPTPLSQFFMRMCAQWRIQGGDPGVRTPPSASTSLIIHYSQSTYDSLHDTAQLAPAPSEKTITGAASSRYALEVDRTSEQSAGLRFICTYTYVRSLVPRSAQ